MVFVNGGVQEDLGRILAKRNSGVHLISNGSSKIK